VGDRADELAALRPTERARLDAFAKLFDTIDASSYSQLADSFESDAVLAAKERAAERAGGPQRRQAIRTAVQSFQDAAAIAYSGRLPFPMAFGHFQSPPDGPHVRATVAASIERAVVALILWDELEDDDRTALLGLWGPLIDVPG
jgi:hypothetical protein